MTNRNAVLAHEGMKVAGRVDATRAGAALIILAAVALAIGCVRHQPTNDLPQPLRQAIANPMCEQPMIPPYQAPPDCKVPGDPCKGFTLVVEVAAEGRAGAAYVTEHRSQALDACMTAGVRDWRFAPARDCGGVAVPAVWTEGYSVICDDVVGTAEPVPYVLPSPMTKLPPGQ